MSRLSHAVQGTKNVFAARWRPKELKIPSWVLSALVYITAIRSISYGIELLFVVTSNPISQMMSFAAIFGIQLWGILMLGAVAVLILGLITRRSILITVGSLLSAAVWVSFAAVLGFGYIDAGDGGRFVVAALATGATWALFFFVQLKSLRRSSCHA